MIAMTTEEAIAVFSSYSPAEKQDFLAQLMHELTIIARDSYEVGRDGLTNPHRVRLVNEIQHRISAFLLALLRDDPQRYPDESLIRIILEQPADEILRWQLSEGFSRVAARRLTAA